MKNTPIIIDIGSKYTKIGYSTQEKPFVEPTIVGHLKHHHIERFQVHHEIDIDSTSTPPIGEEAETHMCELDLSAPMSHGVIRNFEDIDELLLSLSDQKLSTTLDKHPVLIIEPHHHFKREKLIACLFDKLNVPAIAFKDGCELALLSAETEAENKSKEKPLSTSECTTNNNVNEDTKEDVKEDIKEEFKDGMEKNENILKAPFDFTGLVVDCGSGLTRISPVLHGIASPAFSKVSRFAGRSLTHFLSLLLRDCGGYCFCRSGERDRVREVKEEACYVAMDFAKELAEVPEKRIVLEKGQTIMLHEEQIFCPEALFQPRLIESQQNGIHRSCYNAIKRCPPEDQNALLSNIILCGGTTLFHGFAERLQREIENIVVEEGLKRYFILFYLISSFDYI